MSEAPRARSTDVDLTFELHTGQRRVNSRINRPDTRKHLDYAPCPLRIFLHPKGRPHTDAGFPAVSGRLGGRAKGPLSGREPGVISDPLRTLTLQ